MPASPGDFLAAMAGSTAGMVAIVGGLLVSRFVSIDSEQQTAKRLVGDARGRKVVTERRLKDLEHEYISIEADDILDNTDVLDAILQGEREPSEIRRISHSNSKIPPEALPQFIDEVASETQAAATFIGPQLKNFVANKSLRTIRRQRDWAQFRVGYIKGVQIKREYVWIYVYNKVYDALVEDAKRAERDEMGSWSRLTDPVGLDFDPSSMEPAWASHVNEQARIERRYELERTRQQLEDLRNEEQRYINTYYNVARPDKLLYSGLAVLFYYAFVGLVLPVYFLSTGPDTFTPAIKNLFWWFTSGLAAFVIYMGLAARRLAHIRNLRY